MRRGISFPDTYEFDDDTRPRRVVERMLANWTRRHEETRAAVRRRAQPPEGLDDARLGDVGVHRREGGRGAGRAPSDRRRLLEPADVQEVSASAKAPGGPDGSIRVRRRARGRPFLRGLRWPNHASDAGRPGQPLQHLPALGASARADQQSGEGRARGGDRPGEARLLLLRGSRRGSTSLQQDASAAQHRGSTQRSASDAAAALQRARSLATRSRSSASSTGPTRDAASSETDPCSASSKTFASGLPAKLRFGTSSWTFPGWAGLVYHRRYPNQRAFLRESLGRVREAPADENGRRRPGLLRPRAGRRPRRTTRDNCPTDFRAAMKVWQRVTMPGFPRHPRYGDEAGKENPDFLDAEAFARAVHAPARAAFAEHMGPWIVEVSPSPTPLEPSWFCEKLDAFLCGSAGRLPVRGGAARPKAPHSASTRERSASTVRRTCSTIGRECPTSRSRCSSMACSKARCS